MTTANQVGNIDIQMLRESTKQNPKYKALFEVYGKRQRSRQDSTVPRHRRVLKTLGIDMDTKELTEFYKLAQKAGAGRCISGRNGKVSRFIWGVDLRSLADQVNGHKYVLDNNKLAYYKDSQGNKRIDFILSGYKTAPLTADDILKAPPKDRSKRAKRLKAAAPTPRPKPVLAPAPERVSVPTVSGRTVKVKKAGFEIEFPLDMSEADWKDAAFFLNNLSAVG